MNNQPSDFICRDASRRKDNLIFHLRPTHTPENAYDESDAYSQEFIHSLGLKVESGCWSTVDLNLPVIYDFMREARARISKGEATFYGFCMLGQELLDTDEAPGEWYQFTSSRKIECDRDAHGIDTCAAYKMPGNIHIASGPWYNQYVSEKFKTIVEKHQLTGIEFEWLKDTGKYRAAQWYIPIPEYPLGRGIDHPWFDPATLKGSNSKQPLHPTFRTGVWRFDLSQLKRYLQITDPIYQEIFDLFRLERKNNSSHLKIITPRIYFRTFLPTTDFAYNCHQEDNEANTNWPRARGFCFNRKTRDILLANRLIAENDLTMLQIVDIIPDGSCLLDEHKDLPGPLLTPEERQQHRPILMAEWERFIAVNKPVHQATMREALKMLRQEKAACKEDYSRGARKVDLESSLPRLPDDWKAVLAISNGCQPNLECRLLPLAEIPSATRELAEAITAMYDDLPFNAPMITIGKAADGDTFTLVNDKCVMRISHEGYTIIDNWDSIAMFIVDMLTNFYD